MSSIKDRIREFSNNFSNKSSDLNTFFIPHKQSSSISLIRNNFSTSKHSIQVYEKNKKVKLSEDIFSLNKKMNERKKSGEKLKITIEKYMPTSPKSSLNTLISEKSTIGRTISMSSIYSTRSNLNTETNAQEKRYFSPKYDLTSKNEILQEIKKIKTETNLNTPLTTDHNTFLPNERKKTFSTLTQSRVLLKSSPTKYFEHNLVKPGFIKNSFITNLKSNSKEIVETTSKIHSLNKMFNDIDQKRSTTSFKLYNR